MEFTCVFSVGGSLTSYRVIKEATETYTASLQTAQGSRSDIPSTIKLEKTGTGWQATPPHHEILQNLVNAIEGGGDVD